jgi:DNA-binding transcriptional LysR family regulator
VELTDAGRVLQEQARDVLARVDTAIDLTQRAQRGETGELRIGLTRATPLSTQIPRAIFAYRQQFPQVQLKLREMNTLQQIDALMAGELDVGLIRKRALPAPLMSRKLFSDPLALVVHDQHPLVRDLPTDAAVALRLFAHEPFVGFLREVGAGIHDHFIALCRSAGFTPRIVQEAGEASTLISLAASGLGVTVLPASCSHIQVDGARFVALSDRAASSEVHVACRRGAASPLIGHFTRLLQGVSG